jgi:hypothetical protein
MFKSGLNLNFERFRCPTCDTKVIPDELIEDVYQENSSLSQLNKLAKDSEPFKEACKNVIVLYKNFKKSEANLAKTIRPIISTYKTFVKPQISILSNYIKSKKKEIKELPIYKDATKNQRAFKRSLINLSENYTVNRYDLSRHLSRLMGQPRRTFYFCDLRMHIERRFRIRI